MELFFNWMKVWWDFWGKELKYSKDKVNNYSVFLKGMVVF